MLRIITTADTEIMATASAVEQLPAGFPEVRCANPAGRSDHEQLIDEILDGARVVVCRILGGRRGWPGFDVLRARCRELGVALIALGGEAEPDAEMMAVSLAPAGVVAQAGDYLRHGDAANIEQLLRFLADTFLLEGFGFDPPRPVDDLGVYLPGVGEVPGARPPPPHDPARPTIAVAFYRSHRLSGNTGFVDVLCEEIEAAGGNALAVWSYTLRRDGDGRVAALELIAGHADALITTMLATGGSGAADAVVPGGPGGDWQQWDAEALAALGVPVFQAVCATRSRAAWEASAEGLTPLDAATQVAIPEFDGRLLAGVISFKERCSEDSPVGTAVPRYVADRERCARVARLAVRSARLRRTPARERRVAIMLTSFPSLHARVGMAVGLDTPASVIKLLRALGEEGYSVDSPFEHGDELMAALIAAGGYDPDFLTDEQLAGMPLRLPVARYLEWYGKLPSELRAAIEARWGPPPGDLYVDGEEFVIAGLELGNVLCMIQPPRGYGDDPVAIYHDPGLPPTHHYLATYWWLDRVWGADAIVHLGKHGTLEWLPGKMLALSAACAPDAALGDLPLVYPFIVNDPGEGMQAKRRAHAVIVDHLVPPMMRAETYDELAELEEMLDEYARLEVLDPGKLPGLAARIWEVIEQANLQSDLGIEARPDDLGALVERIDGYLCEIKDIQVKDGLHTLGVPPEGEQLRGLVAAMMRIGPGRISGLRRAVGAVFGLDEARLVAAPGAAVAEPPRALLDRFPGPAAKAGDLVDRLEEAQAALLTALAEREWNADHVAEVCAAVLGRRDPEVERSLRFAAAEVVPRLRQASDEIGNVLRALDGRFVPAGPSGSPTRGRIDVLPTGRNFFSVDPRSLPSELSYEAGVRLADALLDRHLEQAGAYPRMVGLVVWGTSAIRTQGDDVAEVLALLGVRPVWNRESRRVTGVEVVPLEELGRPRIDVTVRISGFFRDAFPGLIALIDDAFAAVAALDEPAEMNFVAAHAREDAERLAGQLGEAAAWRQATTRIFGSAPGTYGAGLLQLVETREWRDEGDIAAVYETWGGHAFGRGLDGVEAGAAMRACFRRIEVAVKNVDSHEHDILDSDEYFQYHGGMVATVRALTGSEPHAYVGDSSDPSRVVTRDLADMARRVVRARVLNPRWIASMIRHGYKGAAELSATVDYLFGWDATAGVAEDWMYEQIARRYLLDDDVAAFMSRSNPWAARAIAERLLEAADRGLWADPDEDTLARIRGRYLELEGELEEASA
jgi:cobaltochelatase CobN